MPFPAVVSMNSSWPWATSSATDAGVRPTRYSWTLISFGTPMRIYSFAPAEWFGGPIDGEFRLVPLLRTGICGHFAAVLVAHGRLRGRGQEECASTGGRV